MHRIEFDRTFSVYHIFFIVFFMLFTTCDNIDKSGVTYFKEYGSLLWVNNKMPDSIVKKAVKETIENSSLIIAQVPWHPNSKTIIENINWYYRLAKDHGKDLMINIDWLNNERTGTRGRWSFDNEDVKSQFSKDMLLIVNLYKPKYLTLGVEVNYYAFTSPKGYRGFIDVFNSMKISLKKINPKLKIGLSFQLELLYGEDKEWTDIKTLTTLNAVVENLDFLGVSTYPDLYRPNSVYQFESLNNIDSLVNLYKIPIGISETGISSTYFNETQRVVFIDSVFSKMNKLNFIVWGSMIDDKRDDAWMDRIGLLNPDGSAKIDYKKWISKINKLK